MMALILQKKADITVEGYQTSPSERPNADHNGWAAINEVDVKGFRYGKTDYKVDLGSKKIEIPESVSKETFIENCKLGGLYEVKVQTENEKVSSGDILIVKCGDVEFPYEIVIK